ncbi:unnamed protein product [Dicrocoelium dendriticum]|nr:unnamed protein product [Dicrocoelium dendriticum]
MSDYQSGLSTGNSGTSSTLSNCCIDANSEYRIHNCDRNVLPTFKRLSTHKHTNRLVRKLALHLAVAYLPRSPKQRDGYFATGNRLIQMEGSQQCLNALNPHSDAVANNMSPFTDRETVLVPTSEPLPDADIVDRGVPFCPNFMSQVGKQQQIPEGTVIIDGKTYSVSELLSVITQLKHEAHIYADRITRLEQELQQAKVLLASRDRDIHKLRSVLDLKVPTTANHLHLESKLDTVDETAAVGFASETLHGKSLLQQAEAHRVKKQGVSGESQTAQRTFGLIHHPKDARSCQIIREAILNNDFLRHLDEAQVEEIVQCMYRKEIAQGAYIIREGQTGDALYVVADGVLEVSKDDQLLGHMDVGRAFGELALLYNCNRTASVKAVTMASAWTLDRRVFQQIMMSSSLNRHEENFRFLQSVPALKSLSITKMHKLADVLEEIYYGPDEYIIREGEIGETFFIIKAGRVSHLIMIFKCYPMMVDEFSVFFNHIRNFTS